MITDIDEVKQIIKYYLDCLNVMSGYKTKEQYKKFIHNTQE